MEFDPETLKPTYRFIPGRPGRSYGLDMASRLGVPDSVVRDARSRLTGEEAGLDRLLEQVERDSRELRSELQRAAGERQAAERFKAEAERLHRAAAEEERNAKTKAKTEAREVLAGLRQKLKELAKVPLPDRTVVARERQEIDALAQKLEPADEEYAALPLRPAEVHPGDRVRVPRLRKTGTVLFASHDTLEVEADGVKFRLSLREVVPAGPAAAKKQTVAAPGWGASIEEREGLPDRVILIGLRVTEAVAETERFIDRAAMQGLSQVTIIHGLGTGALKAAVTDYLRGHPLVQSFRTGEPSEGGAGVTVVELKK
jgi:DNA mismatch repair protein MutS2